MEQNSADEQVVGVIIAGELDICISIEEGCVLFFVVVDVLRNFEPLLLVRPILEEVSGWLEGLALIANFVGHDVLGQSREIILAMGHEFRPGRSYASSDSYEYFSVILGWKNWQAAILGEGDLQWANSHAG